MSEPIGEQPAKALREVGEMERRVVEFVTRRLHISHDINRQFDSSRTFGERLADRITSFGGSWTFILIFLAVLLAWVVLNTVILVRVRMAFDPYPYIFLNLVLSMVAALQAPLIMMSQNRSAAKDRVAAEHDYEVNLKAELEILALHQKIDSLMREQWIELVAMQQEQIQLLTRLIEERRLPPSPASPGSEPSARQEFDEFEDSDGIDDRFIPFSG
ncbi:DUF1003 domain-containing protein [Isosphaeraceae bacterium EP7]